MLFAYFRENPPLDTVQINERFSRLDAILRKLPLKEHDRVWNVTCDLYVRHEQLAYYAGIRTGMRLIEELNSLEGL